MLALVGSGEYLPPMKPVDEFLLSLLPAEPYVACLPTASGKEGSERIRYWSDLGVKHFESLGARAEAINVIDWPSANDPELAEKVASAHLVYLSSGKPDYLYHCLNGSRVWDAILAVLTEGGILAGCSAGAMVLGERFFGFPGWNKGLKLLPGAVIIPDYDEMPEGMLRPVRLLTSKSFTMFGIERNTALIEMGEEFKVVGTGGVTVWNALGKTRFLEGDMPSNFQGQNKAQAGL